VTADLNRKTDDVPKEEVWLFALKIVLDFLKALDRLFLQLFNSK